MALGDAYLNDAIDGIAAAPPRAPEQPQRETRGSVWGLASAIPRGITEAAAQTGAAVVETVKGFGDVLGAYPEALGPVTLTDQQRRQADQQRQKLLTDGIDVETNVGRALRSAGATYRPDPQTATTAEQVLYGFARGATKVVTAAPAGPAGFVMAGTGEAMTAADDLAQQGVPQGPAMAAGAVQGAGLALAGLPLIGSTLGRTAALYVAGGPGGFMAQQALTREILRDAGQDQVAEQFDPFDPVGLAVSALVPAGFAAYGLRAQRLQRAAASLPNYADLPRTPADAVTPPLAATPEPFPGRLSPVAEAARAYPTEVVDAAMAMNIGQRARSAEAFTDRAQWEASGRAVHENILGQLRAAGRFDEAANLAYAEATRAFYDATAARLGITPEELFARYPLTIRSEGAPAAADALAQARVQTQTPEFKAWFGDSKVVDASGAPLVVYHGSPDARFATPGKGDGVFKTKREAAFGSDPGRAFFFAADQRVARTYADPRRAFDYQNAEEGMVPVFLSLKNPMVIDAGGQHWRGTEGAIEQARAAGHDGVIIRNSRDTYMGRADQKNVPVTDVYVAFNPEQIKSAIGNRGAFDPADPSILNQGDAARGTYTPAERAITLLEGADYSTYLHESGHFYLDVLGDIASRPDAPAGIVEDMNRILEWFGVEGDAGAWRAMSLDQQRPYHEQFARGIERYFAEGRAPTPALDGLFARVKRWMMQVYRSLADLNVNLTDEVRGVFDRLMAREGDIRERGPLDEWVRGFEDLAAEAQAAAQALPTVPAPAAAAPVMDFAARLDAALERRGIAVRAGDRSFSGGDAGAREITLADMPEGEFMAKHGNSVLDVKAHEFAHTWWDGATALPNFRDPRNTPLRQELRAISREFRPFVWERHADYANKPSELLADGLAFWLKNPNRRAEFPLVDKLIRDYDAGSLQREFPDSNATPTPQTPNPEAAAPAGGPGAAAGRVPAAGAGAGAAAGLNDARVAAVRQQFPDLMVQLDGMDAPMRLDEFLASVKAEADDLAADAPLMEIAAQCALINGAG